MSINQTFCRMFLISWPLLVSCLTLVQSASADGVVFVAVSSHEVHAPSLGRVFKIELGEPQCEATVAESCWEQIYLNVYGKEHKRLPLTRKYITDRWTEEELRFAAWHAGKRNLLSISPRKSMEMYVYDVDDDKLSSISAEPELAVDSISYIVAHLSFEGDGRYVAGTHRDGCGFVIDILDLDKPKEVLPYYGTNLKGIGPYEYLPALQRELYLLEDVDTDSWLAFYFECSRYSQKVDLKDFAGRRLERVGNQEAAAGDLLPWSRKLATLESVTEAEIVVSKYVVFREILKAGGKQYLVFDFPEAHLWEVPYSPGQGPDKAVSHYFLAEGLMLYENKDYIGSARLLTKSVEIDPGNGEAHYNLARSFSMQGEAGGNLKRAQEHLRRASELDTRYEEAAKNDPAFSE